MWNSGQGGVVTMAGMDDPVIAEPAEDLGLQVVHQRDEIPRAPRPSGSTRKHWRVQGPNTTPSPPRSLRAVLYTRISEDATGQAIGVNRQLDYRDMAAIRAFHVIDEVHDNDVSALKVKRRRGYEQVLARWYAPVKLIMQSSGRNRDRCATGASTLMPSACSPGNG